MAFHPELFNKHHGILAVSPFTTLRRRRGMTIVGKTTQNCNTTGWCSHSQMVEDRMSLCFLVCGAWAYLGGGDEFTPQKIHYWYKSVKLYKKIRLNSMENLHQSKPSRNVSSVHPCCGGCILQLTVECLSGRTVIDKPWTLDQGFH